jgi:hypothetical protein
LTENSFRKAEHKLLELYTRKEKAAAEFGAIEEL